MVNKDKQIEIDQNLGKTKKKKEVKIDVLFMYFDKFFRKIVHVEYMFI